MRENQREAAAWRELAAWFINDPIAQYYAIGDNITGAAMEARLHANQGPHKLYNVEHTAESRALACLWLALECEHDDSPSTDPSPHD